MVSEELQKELREKYNPDGSPARLAQLRMLDMLVFFDRVCRENNLIYWLDSGTLLGAVRHGGFIPWDDDVDVVMPRKELYKLRKILKSEKYKNFQYQLQNSKTDSGFFDHWDVLRDTKSEYLINSKTHTRRKYRGLQVDIFPIDYEVSPKLHNFAKKVKQRTIERMTFRPFPNFIISIPDFFLRYLLYPLFRKITLPKYKNTCMYGIGIPFPHLIRKKNLFPLTEIQFEGHKFYVPNNFSGYLFDLYKNWEELPAENKRQNPAHATAYRFL